MKNDVIKLITVEKGQDASGFEVDTLTEYEVLAEIKSVGRTEFYMASHEGIKVAIIAVVNLDDWDAISSQPEKVSYNGDTYRIVRQYKSKKLDIELTLEQVETDG